MNKYKSQGAKRACYYQEDIFEYTKIQRLVYNEYHERLDIYGRSKNIQYWNYFTGEIGSERGLKSKDNRVRFFLYYKDSKDFINTVVEKSGVQLEIINYPEE